MITFRISARRLAVALVLVAVLAIGVASFTVFSLGAHAGSSASCADAGAAPDCTTIYSARFSQHSAYAQFTQTDNNPDCAVTTSMSVWAGDTVQRANTTPPTGSGPAMTVGIYQTDCNYNVIYDASGMSTNVTMNAPGNNLQSASATGTVTITDSISGNSEDVTVNLNCVGIGSTFRGIWNSHQQYPDHMVINHESGTDRTAICSGSVVSGTTDYTGGASGTGSLSIDDQGNLYIIR